MIPNHYGELAALAVAVFWSITALSFEAASKRAGSLPVNLIRLLVGFIFLSVFNYIFRGRLLPLDASEHNWIWLCASGLIGFSLGDLCLMQSFTLIGSWLAMLIMTLAPALAAVFGRLILGEQLSGLSMAGMAITLTGIALAIWQPQGGKVETSPGVRAKGLLLAFGGALGQALGIVLSKYGMQGYPPFAATQIRVLAGIAGFMVIVTIFGKWTHVRFAAKNKGAMAFLTLGAFFGPFLGVSFSLLAIQYTSTGIASTIMATVPIFLIPPSILLFRHRITFREVLGTAVSIVGLAVFFL